MLQPLSPSTTLPVRTNVKSSSSSINVKLQQEFLGLMRGSKVQEVERFLKQHSENVDVNQYNLDGQTPLHEACQMGDLATVKVLLQFGANPHLTNRDGFSIVHLATFSGNSELLVLVMNTMKKC